MELALTYFMAILLGYFLGSIPTGFIVARRRGVDIRDQGSGNIGATNVFRMLGWRAGILVLAIDALKGWIACVGSLMLLGDLVIIDGATGINVADANRLMLAGGFASVLGHNFTPWLGFKGGKGIATTAGVLVGLTPWGFLSALVVFLMFLALTRMVSLASLMAALVLPLAVWLHREPFAFVATCTLMSLLAVVKHRGNIKRIVSGTEPRLGQKKSHGKEPQG